MNPSKTTTSIFFVLFSIAFFLFLPPLTIASSHVTAVFAFGDSTLDAGNNNGLSTVYRGDHMPYGKDFPEHLPVLQEGVTFASAGSGLDNLTASFAGAFPMSKQLDYFDEAVKRIKKLVGEENGRTIVENAIFIISAGTNDMLDNFYESPTRAFQFSLSGYQDFLLKQLASTVERLYNAGGRRLVLVGLPPIGCLPVQVTIGSILPGQNMFQRRKCVEQQNVDSVAYNNKLQGMIESNKLKDAKVAYLDIYNIMKDMLEHPANYGFDQILEGCCGIGMVEMGPLCNAVDPICPDASKYMFWDAVHPTQATCKVIANVAMKNVIPYLLS